MEYITDVLLYGTILHSVVYFLIDLKENQKKYKELFGRLKYIK